MAPQRLEKPPKIRIDTKVHHAFITAAYRSSRCPAGRIHIRINRHGNKFSPFGPFISQVPADECLQQISRILCPAPYCGAVSPRRIATAIHPRMRTFPSHLSIRPDSPCHQLMEHGFGPPEGSISPGFKNVLLLRNWVAKAILAQALRKLSGTLHRFYARQIGRRSGSLYNVEVDYRNIRALKLHRQRQPNISQTDNSYFYYLVSLSEGCVFLYRCRFRRKEEQPGI